MFLLSSEFYSISIDELNISFLYQICEARIVGIACNFNEIGQVETFW